MALVSFELSQITLRLCLHRCLSTAKHCRRCLNSVAASSSCNAEDSDSVAWMDVAIKCLPFVVVGLVVMLSVSFIAIGSLLYMGTSNRPGLGASSPFKGLDDPDLFLTMNPSFGQDGVRMEASPGQPQLTK